LPVFDRVVIVRVEVDGSVSAMSSNVDFVDPSIITVPAFTQAVAEDRALASVNWPGSARSTSLGIWMAPDGARLSWRVSLIGPVASKAAVIYVDALDATILAAFNPIRTARGLVFLQNPVRDSETPTEVDLPRLAGDETLLTGEYAQAWKYDPGGFNAQTAVADVSGDFLYTPVAQADEPGFDDQFAEVNGYYHIDWISNYYRTNHGHTPPHSPMKIYVNYVEDVGVPYENAFFDPESWSISMGQTATGDFAYDVDTIFHEFTHSVNQAVASLVYFGADQYGMLVFPGGLDEGLADTFAVSITDDPDMSEYIYGRNLVNINTCPENIVGEVHVDGEIVGGANWEIHEVVGGQALQTMAFGSLSGLLPDASFADYAAGVMAAAEALESDGDITATQVADIQTILDERGMSTCHRFMSVDDGVTRDFSILGMDAMGACDFMFPTFETNGYFFPPDFQWTIDVPEDATSLTITADTLILGANGDETIAINVRTGAPIVHEMVEIFGGMSFPLLVQDADWIFENPDGPVVIDSASEPPLTPGETYYFSVGYRGCPMMQVTVGAQPGFEVAEPEPELEPEPEDQPEPMEDADADADVPDPDGDMKAKGGCGCTIVD
jgi:Zn-dependent metalloprotease